MQFHSDDGVSATWRLGWFGWRRRQRTECTKTVHVPRQFGEASFREHCLCVTQLCCLVRLRSFRFYLATFCRVIRVVREFDFQMLKGIYI